jgi:cellulose biosynthesis protein BcsQ
MLRNSSAIASADVYAKLNNSTANVYDELRHIIRTELFSYLPPFRAALMSLGLRYSIFERIAVNAKNSREYDYIVVDADTAFDEENAHMMHTADKVVIVTDQHRRAVYATNILAANINGISADKYFFICNNFDKDDNNSLVNADGGLRFSVNDYVEHIPRYDQLTCEDLPNSNGIQRVSVLIM